MREEGKGEVRVGTSTWEERVIRSGERGEVVTGGDGRSGMGRGMRFDARGGEWGRVRMREG